MLIVEGRAIKRRTDFESIHQSCKVPVRALEIRWQSGKGACRTKSAPSRKSAAPIRPGGSPQVRVPGVGVTSPAEGCLSVTAAARPGTVRHPMPANPINPWHETTKTRLSIPLTSPGVLGASIGVGAAHFHDQLLINRKPDRFRATRTLLTCESFHMDYDLSCPPGAAGVGWLQPCGRIPHR
jgi:hypothetical protein